MPSLNPDVLRWARETADLSVEEAARKVGLRDSGKGTAAERLQAIEVGEEEPTRAVLARMSRAYRRPLLALYLPEPPRSVDRGGDFRSLPTGYHDEEEALVDALLRDVRVRQHLIRVAMEDEEEADPLEWVATHGRDDGVRALVRTLERVLGMGRVDFRAVAGMDAAFQLLRDRVEAAGAFVLLVGDLGSHHTQIDVDVFRGFALADPVAPFIVVNDQDARSAWSFTLLHEFVHLLLGVTGISAGFPSATLERFCNDVASAFLVTDEELADVVVPRPLTLAELASTLGAFSRRWNVSRSMLTYRLFRAGQLSQPAWAELTDQFEDEWLRLRERSKAKARVSDGGPNYYVVRRHRLGLRLVQVTSRMLRAGALTTTRAGQVLGVSPKNVGPLLAESPGG